MNSWYSKLSLFWIVFFMICTVISLIIAASPADPYSMLGIWLILWMVFALTVIGTVTVTLIVQNVYNQRKAAGILWFIVQIIFARTSLIWNGVACWLIATEDNLQGDSEELWGLVIALMCVYLILDLLHCCFLFINCYLNHFDRLEDATRYIYGVISRPS